MYSVQRPSSASSTATDVSNFSQNAKYGPDFDGHLKLIATINCGEEVICCRFSSDGRYLAVGFKDGVIKIYSVENCSCLYSLYDDNDQKPLPRLPVTSIQFQVPRSEEKAEHANILIASYASGFIKFWHFTSQQCIHTIQEDRTVFCVALNHDGSQFVTTGDGPQYQIHLYDGETKIRTKTLEASDSKDKMDGHKSRVFAAQFHPRYNKVFITGGWDDTVQFWSTETSHSVRKISGPHICGFEGIDIDPEHDHILTASWRKNNSLQIWDFGKAELIKDVPTDPLVDCSLYCCQWLGRDKIICGGGDKNMARVIDRGTLSTTGLLLHLNQSVYSIDNDGSKDSPPLIAIGSGKCIYLVRSMK